MKQVKFLLLAAFVAMFTGCQNEEIMEQDSEKDEPVPTGDTRIIIEGEGMLETSARSSDGRVDFTGGYATGAGLYDGRKNVPVEAHPDAGYEVNYFYGGPANQPKKFIPTLRSSRNTDRLFHLIFPCSFRISCSAFTCIDRQCAFFFLESTMESMVLTS